MLSIRGLSLALAAVLALSACSVSLLPGGSGGGGSSSSSGSTLPQVTEPGAYRAESARHQGGRITIGTDQLPTALSAYFDSEAAAVPVDQVIFDGLVGTAPDLSAYGDLAVEAPTESNGGVKHVGSGMDL